MALNPSNSSNLEHLALKVLTMNSYYVASVFNAEMERLSADVELE